MEQRTILTVKGTRLLGELSFVIEDDENED